MDVHLLAPRVVDVQELHALPPQGEDAAEQAIDKGAVGQDRPRHHGVSAPVREGRGSRAPADHRRAFNGGSKRKRPRHSRPVGPDDCMPPLLVPLHRVVHRLRRQRHR
eukprot:3935507-Rhodomonas_salina.3